MNMRNWIIMAAVMAGAAFAFGCDQAPVEEGNSEDRGRALSPREVSTARDPMPTRDRTPERVAPFAPGTQPVPPAGSSY
jgi:hypothetical protein